MYVVSMTHTSAADYTLVRLGGEGGRNCFIVMFFFGVPCSVRPSVGRSVVFFFPPDFCFFSFYVRT